MAKRQYEERQVKKEGNRKKRRSEQYEENSNASEEVESTRQESEEEVQNGEAEEYEDDDMTPTQDLGMDMFRKSEVAECGIIESIELKKFMCHDHLTIKMHPVINVVTGFNGSGKSAILTGLTIALGGKAKDTNRGGSMKELIKANAQQATISVKLKNRGEDAFRPELYGDSIIVERVIRHNGSEYRLKSQNGTVVGKSKEDLADMLDHFQIQIDNPVQILNQDTSRSFLTASDPREKYKFFTQATQLSHMVSNYKHTHNGIVIIKETIDQNKKDLDDLKRATLEAEKRFTDAKNRSKQRDELAYLEKALQWALVAEIEKDRDERKKDLDDLAKEMEDIQASKQQAETKKAALQEEISAKKVALDEKKAQLEQQQKELSELVKSKSTRRDKFKKIKNKWMECKSTVNSKDSEVKFFLDRIETLRQQSDRDLDAEKRQREEQIDAKRAELEAIEGDLREAQQDCSDKKMELDGLKRQEAEKNEYLRELQRQIDQTKRDRDHAMAAQKNSMKVWGAETPGVLAEIQRNRRQFRKMPVGPIGMHVSLPAEHSRWSVAIEAAIGKCLNTYACDNMDDQRVLRDILNKVYRGKNVPSIVVSKFEDHPYDVSAQKSSVTQYPTVYDLIEIDNVYARNTLHDMTPFEKFVLTETREQAQQLMRSGPRNTATAYDIKGNETKERSFFFNTNNRPPRLAQDFEAQIARLMDQLANDEARERTFRPELGRLKEQIRVAQGDLKEAERKLRIYQSSYDTVEGELQAVLAEAEPQQETDFTQLNEDLDNLRREADQARIDMDKTEQEMHAAEREAQELDEAINDCKAFADTLSTEVEALMAAVRKVVEKKLTFDGDLEKCRREEAKSNELSENTTNELRETEQLLAHELERAMKMSEERIETQYSAKKLEKKVQSLRQAIAQQEAQHGSLDEISRDFTEKKKRLDDLVQTLKNMDHLRKELVKSLEQRKVAFMEMRHFLTARTTHFFTTLLQQRGFVGRILISHSRQTLDFDVRAKDEPTSGATSRKNTNSLSGGERSYTTICFITSLWEALACPFRCLDEFDVFMDLVNRKMSFRILKDMATQQRNRQLILITPQDPSEVGAQDMRVHRLQPPERNQSTLDAHAQPAR